jgi:NADPH:quinone reductase-like Zn-dependent oxidoreductase
MNKIVVHKAGSHDRLKLEEQVTPEPGSGEIRISVAAAGVNYADCIVRMGLYESAKKYVGWPITPGFEVAGVVDALGDGVGDLNLGDPVIASTRFGGYTSHLVVPRNQVFKKPDCLSMEQAAAIPAVYLTAWFALHFLAHPREGDSILIHSAAGGVGGAACQLARQAGCKSVGVVGASHKVDSCQADVVIDKSSQDLWAEAEKHAPKGYEVILDANGVATLQQSYNHLAAPGKLVSYGFHTMMPKTGGKPNWIKLAIDYFRTPRFSPLDLTGRNRSVMGFNLSYLFNQADELGMAMNELLAGFTSGALTPPPVTSYPLAEAGRAHADLESAQTVGKLVLIP